MQPLDESKQLFEQANNAHQAGDFKEAIDGYIKLLQDYPNNSMINMLAGVAYQQINDQQNAAKFIDKALQLEPLNVQILDNAGEVYKNQGDLSRAAYCYERVHEQMPNEISYLYKIAELKHMQNDMQAAMICYDKIITLNPKETHALQNLINLLISIEEYPAAIQQIHYGLIEHRNNPQIVDVLTKALINAAKLCCNKGTALERCNKPDEAIHHYQTAIEADPKCYHAYVNLAYTLSFQDFHRWIEFLERNQTSLKDSPNHSADLNMQYAIAHWLNVEPLKATRQLKKAIQYFDQQDNKYFNFYVLEAYLNYLQRLFEYSGDVAIKGVNKTAIAIGDSHVLSWLAAKPKQFDQVKPHLIFGAKAWHIGNPDASSFQHALQHFTSRYNNQSLIFTFGEIDCRTNEGIFQHHLKTGLALNDIVTYTVGNYCQALLHTQKGKHNTVYIQGVPYPLGQHAAQLNEQQKFDYFNMVREFNLALREQCEENHWEFIDVYLASKKYIADGFDPTLDTRHLKPELLSELL